MQAVDSFSPHTDRSCQALADQGYVGALRYQYNTSRSEVDRLHAHGLAFGLILELNGNAALVNPEIGALHGQRAVAFARSIGLPAGCAIYFAEADTHIRRENFPGATRYWALAAGPTRDAGYRVGAYGGSKLIDHLHEVGVADLTWETAAMSWNEYVHSQTCSLRQLLGQPVLGGVQVDVNDVLAQDWGQWNADGTVGRPTDNEEDDMTEATKRLLEDSEGRTWLCWDGFKRHLTKQSQVDTCLAVNVIDARWDAEGNRRPGQDELLDVLSPQP